MPRQVSVTSVPQRLRSGPEIDVVVSPSPSCPRADSPLRTRPGSLRLFAEELLALVQRPASAGRAA
ncbi:MAG: hypothetical protein KY454_10680 [Actinobacteria bacterium]|nr:hypothetical protein [Actinomycetota bacterium]